VHSPSSRPKYDYHDYYNCYCCNTITISIVIVTIIAITITVVIHTVIMMSQDGAGTQNAPAVGGGVAVRLAMLMAPS